MPKTLCAILVICLIQLPSPLQSAERKRSVADDTRAQVRAAAAEVRRKWLRSQLVRRLKTADQVAQLDARLARMSPQQINDLCTEYLAQLRRRRKAEKASRDRERLLPHQRRSGNSDTGSTAGERVREERAVKRRTGNGQPDRIRPGRGFVPIISWLPSGASLSASAVVSPDGRYVRMQAFPFFSTIGPVHTFNFFTGETRLLYPGPQDPFGRPPPQPRIYHDGLRTRVEPR